MMLSLYLEAPFAVCRTFTAGWYRPTATFLTPSAAYGLLLNLAGIESRLREEDPLHGGKVPTTIIRAGLPHMRLAIGVPTVSRTRGRWHGEELLESDRFPRVQTLYQQLHNYPVGSSAGDRAATTFGNKYNITPVRREVLVGLRAVVAVDAGDELEQAVRRGVSGEAISDRYGLPFVGDNSFLPDRIELLPELPPVQWFERVTEDQTKVRPRTTRMTMWIDRADHSRTRSALYAPGEVIDGLPDGQSSAWTAVTPE